MGRGLGDEDQLKQDGADRQRLVLEQCDRGGTDPEPRIRSIPPRIMG